MRIAVMLSGWLLLASIARAQVQVPTPGWGIGAKSISPPVIVGGSLCSSTDGKWRIGISGGLPTPPNGNGVGVYTLCERYYSVSPGNPGIAVWLEDNCVDFPIDPAATGVTMVDYATRNGWDIYAKQTLTDYASPWHPVVSPWSNPFTPVNGTPPQPDFPEVPLWECGWATLVNKHQPGDQLDLVSTVFGQRFHVPSALGTTDYMPAGSDPFKGGEMVKAQVTTCEGYAGNASNYQTVAIYPYGQLPQPYIEGESVIEGGSVFAVDRVVNGATINVRLDRNGSPTTWQEHCGGPTCTAFVPSALGSLLPGDKLAVTQELCPGSASTETGYEVADCANSLSPVPDPAPRTGASVIHLSRYPQGVWIGVFATSDSNPTAGLRRIGLVYNTPDIPLTEPIQSTDKCVIISVYASCTPPYSGGFFVGK